MAKEENLPFADFYTEMRASFSLESLKELRVQSILVRSISDDDSLDYKVTSCVSFKSTKFMYGSWFHQEEEPEFSRVNGRKQVSSSVT